MDNQLRKLSAVCLFSGALLATITMAIHPTGGSLERITQIRDIIVFSHIMAICCLPLIGFGGWGLSVMLQTPNRLSILGFFIFGMGLVAAMIAGAVNGLVLPKFAMRYSASEIDPGVLKSIANYGYYLNAAMTNIFTGASAFAIGLWSVVIVRSRKLPLWLGFYGWLLTVLFVIGMASGFNFLTVRGFGLYVLALVSWLVLAGITMLLARGFVVSESE